MCHLLWPSWRTQKKCGDFWWKSEFDCQSKGFRYIKHQGTHCAKGSRKASHYFLFILISVKILFFTYPPRLLNPLKYHLHQFDQFDKVCSIVFDAFYSFHNGGHYFAFLQFATDESNPLYILGYTFSVSHSCMTKIWTRNENHLLDP